MKKVLVTLLVLGLASAANAGLSLSVSGPTDAMNVGDTVSLSIVGADPVPGSDAPWVFVQGAAAGINGGTLVYGGSLSAYQDAESVAADLGQDVASMLADLAALGFPGLSDLSFATLADGSIPPAPLTGTLVDGITLTALQLGEATVTLLNGDFSTADSVAVNVIPEPMTIALLGLGGLFLRRRK